MKCEARKHLLMRMGKMFLLTRLFFQLGEGDMDLSSRVPHVPCRVVVVQMLKASALFFFFLPILHQNNLKYAAYDRVYTQHTLLKHRHKLRHYIYIIPYLPFNVICLMLLRLAELEKISHLSQTIEVKSWHKCHEIIVMLTVILETPQSIFKILSFHLKYSQWLMSKSIENKFYGFM